MRWLVELSTDDQARAGWAALGFVVWALWFGGAENSYWEQR